MDPLHPEPELLDHLVVEFGDHGRRAVEFLATAEHLLRRGADSAEPRIAEAITYCLREAMKTIPASQDVGGGGLWRTASRTVADARRRYELARGVPGEDEPGALAALLAAIDDLEAVHAQESVHAQRLIAIMVNRTGAVPIAAGTTPIRAYHALLGELDAAAHGTTTIKEATALWDRCIGILRQLFLPPDIRHAELETLAHIDQPEAADVDRLLSLIAGPNHLRHFLGRLTTPGWLSALGGAGVLDPPSENGPWPVFAAVDNLSRDHASAVAVWLTGMYDLHRGDAVRAWFIARAAVDVGLEGAPLVVRAVRDHISVPAVCSLGVWAAEKLDSRSDLIESLADVLLNAAAAAHTPYVDPLVEKFVNGVNETNAGRRLQLVSWKLAAIGPDEAPRRWMRYERAGSIADWTDERAEDRFSVLIRAFVDTARRASVWLLVDEVLDAADSLPDDLRGRARAWILSIAKDVDLTRVIDELARAIAERDPTGDDLALLDRVTAEADTASYADVWMSQLGPAPGVAEVAQALAAHELPEQWLRAYYWTAVMPEAARGAWVQPVSVIAAAHGKPTRAALEKRQRGEAAWGHSPMTVDDLSAMTPVEASQVISRWRPGSSDWLVSARELGRTLEAVVKASPGPWVEAPLRITTELRHPTYIHHFLRALAEVLKGVDVPIDEVLDVIRLVRAHPWKAEPLGRDNGLDFDLNWREAERASIDVLKALADADLGFAGHEEEVWGLLDAEVRDLTEPSGIVSGAHDPLETAINRRCMRALEAAIALMAYEVRAGAEVRPDALLLLEDCLRVEGQDGAEYRAIVATRLGFLRHIAPTWLDGIASLLFGQEAPAELAQTTADLAIKWSRPNRWLLERFRPLVRDAVAREIDHALEHLLAAMLWQVTGYGVNDNVTFLRQSPALLSNAGETLGRILSHGDADGGHIACAVTFWDAAIGTNDAAALAGFGWMAEIENLDADDWAEHTAKTLTITHGRIDWSHKVAERATELAPSTTTLDIMNHLVRGATDEWDRRGNIERAATLLRTADNLAGTPAHERLRTTLLERGAH